ncbi:MAG TPA: GTP-binding protein [candidate division WOR-3 bacterium]|uniref:GTP-binding protein n=1 Tax=candidate division WOR-3 bacterium TaxID=2052148 RepID=A0A7C5DBB4_UNCW3|nr:GTP-binding protein [candidate division WOR-3 bacterium]
MTRDIEEKIRVLEEELKRTEYNKATEHHIGKLKAKIAKLREELEKRRSQGKGGLGYDIKRSGDASVAIIGPPSVGKSSLMNALIGKEVSPVGHYAFTTIKVVPGMLEYHGINIQLLDLPGILEGASQGRGEGRKVLSVARAVDMILVVLDVYTYSMVDAILQELFNAGIRLNKKRPDIKIKKTGSGGINILAPQDLCLDKSTIKDILIELGYHSAEVIINDKDVSLEDIIDAAFANRAYIPGIFVINKIDLIDNHYIQEIIKYFKERQLLNDTVFVSATRKVNVDILRNEILNRLSLVRIYLKPPNGDPDYENPLVLKSPAKVLDVCERLGSQFIKYFNYACVWGKSVKYPGQRVSIEHQLYDGDIITIYLKRRL